MFGKPTEDGVMFFDVLAPHEFPFAVAMALADSIDDGYMLNVYVDDDKGVGIVELGPYDYYLYEATDEINIMPLGNGREYAEALYCSLLVYLNHNREEFGKYVEDTEEFIEEFGEYELVDLS